MAVFIAQLHTEILLMHLPYSWGIEQSSGSFWRVQGNMYSGCQQQ